MLIVIITVLLLIWAAVVGSIYSNFVVFYSNFSESENYHKAYYSAISALERGELVTKQRSPWFIWSGWRILWVTSWTNNWSDKVVNSDFSYLSDTSTIDKSTVFRTINSRATRIPATWQWDVEWALSANDSADYNMMDYDNAQIFLLYYDNSGGNPYTKTTCPDWCNQSRPQKISGIIRLPGLLQWFWNLDESKTLVTVWWKTSPNNDAIVDRQIRWYYDSKPFTIYSTQKVHKNVVQSFQDNIIRENDINNEVNFEFENNRSPIARSISSDRTIVSEQENEIKNSNFKDVLNNNKTTNSQLRFSLLNLLKTSNNMIYPFLEYYIDFWTEVSDKYFAIDAEWNFADYKINLRIWKPTSKESVLSSFTTIFK